MDCKRVNGNRQSVLAGGAVAKTLDKNECDYCLMISEASVNCHVHEVGLNWN
jgi:hypothetical protein